MVRKHLKYMKIRKTDVVSAVICRNKKILVVKRSSTTHYFPGMLVFPGGKREANESIIEAVKREVLEETGYLVVELAPAVFTGKANRDGVTASFYLIKCEIVGSKTVEKDENAIRKLWVKPETLLISLENHGFYPVLTEFTKKFLADEGLL